MNNFSVDVYLSLYIESAEFSYRRMLAREGLEPLRFFLKAAQCRRRPSHACQKHSLCTFIKYKNKSQIHVDKILNFYVK